ncbi:hypothetical protein HK102_003805 [Quaeritorhiza haematococci]|nr:hypothetical protein HK102_003805 [Quaeritorhiza haematococci]
MRTDTKYFSRTVRSEQKYGNTFRHKDVTVLSNLTLDVREAALCSQARAVPSSESMKSFNNGAEVANVDGAQAQEETANVDEANVSGFKGGWGYGYGGYPFFAGKKGFGKKGFGGFGKWGDFRQMGRF